MTTNVSYINSFPENVPYLRTSRNYPIEDVRQLAIEVNRAYVDIANAVNNRIISVFTNIEPIVTGETWIANGVKQQTFRQIFTFTSTTPITHNIPVLTPRQFTAGYGTYADEANTYGLIFASNTVMTGQISFYVTSTQIIFVTGVGAPTLLYGVIVLEWLSSP